MEPIHNRMPVILPREVERLWIDRETSDLERLNALLVPYPAQEMAAYAVSPLVNSVRHDSPAIIESATV